MTVEPSYRIHIGATNKPNIGVVHDGMSLKEAMALVPEGMGLRIMEGVNGSILFGIPDTRVQDFADAWDKADGRMLRAKGQLIRMWPELVVLFDALNEENKT